MITQRHAHILDKPHSQIKLLKHDHADNLPIIKANHQGAWQDFKAFILSVYANLPTQFATPHIKKWCNGWQIRNHFFAYFKYDAYLGNAPIISVILNKKRLMIQLDWHAYKAAQSASTLANFNTWIDADLSKITDGDLPFYYWTNDTDEYGNFMPMSGFYHDFNDQHLDTDTNWFRVDTYILAEDLDDFDADSLVSWAVQTTATLSDLYRHCHGKLTD